MMYLQVEMEALVIPYGRHTSFKNGKMVTLKIYETIHNSFPVRSSIFFKYESLKGLSYVCPRKIYQINIYLCVKFKNTVMCLRDKVIIFQSKFKSNYS